MLLSNADKFRMMDRDYTDNHGSQKTATAWWLPAGCKAILNFLVDNCFKKKKILMYYIGWKNSLVNIF